MPEVNVTLAKERVAAGAELLDRKRPGWHRVIDASTLSMRSPTRCILGQLYGHYERGRVLLFEGRYLQIQLHGFVDSMLLSERYSFEILDLLWRGEIGKRLADPVTSNY